MKEQPQHGKAISENIARWIGTGKPLWLYFALGLSYVAISLLFEHFAGFSDGVITLSPWYPVCGLTLAVLLTEGISFAPWVLIAILAGNIWNYHLPSTSTEMILGTAATTTTYVAATVFLKRVCKIDLQLRRIRDLACFLLAAMMATAAEAFINCAVMVWTDQVKVYPARAVTLHLFLGLTTGAVSVGSFLLIHVLQRLNKKRNDISPEIAHSKARNTIHLPSLRLETFGQFGFLLLILWLAYRHTIELQDLFNLLFLCIIWIAVRSGIRGVAVGLVLLNLGIMLVQYSHHQTMLTMFRPQALTLLVTLIALWVGGLSSEREAAREKLEQQTAYLDGLLQSSPLATVVHDPNGKILLTNPAFERLFGYSSNETLGVNVNTLMKSSLDRQEEPADITTRVVSGEPIHIRSLRCHKDGTGIQIELLGVPLVVEGRLAGGIGIYKDIREQTKLEQELLLAQKLQAVGQLAGGVAHDFNNVLGVVQGYSEYLLDRIPETNPLRECAEEILHASKRAQNLTRQLLAFGRKQVVQPEILDLNKSIESMAKMLTRLIGEDVELIVKPGVSLGTVKADAGQIEQVIMNLAVNSRDAMPTGGKLLISTANVYLREQDDALHTTIPSGNYVMLLVNDNGAGMSEETRDHIFDPFFTTKETGKGTGLGLTTVYGIVHQAGGYIRVETELKKGTTIRLFFPRLDQEIEEKPAIEEHSGLPRGAQTILLVEDESVLRKMLGSFLESSGYTVLLAESASEAAQHVQMFSGDIHLLLTDVVMPQMNGPDLAHFLQALRPEMKVLYMSGYTNGALKEKAILTKDVEFIQKPFSRISLGRRIREIFDNQSLPKEIHTV